MILNEPLSRQLLSDVIAKAVSAVGTSSPVSAPGREDYPMPPASWNRCGCYFSKAAMASPRPPRAYMALDSPTFLFDTWKAFQL